MVVANLHVLDSLARFDLQHLFLFPSRITRTHTHTHGQSVIINIETSVSGGADLISALTYDQEVIGVRLEVALVEIVPRRARHRKRTPYVHNREVLKREVLKWVPTTCRQKRNEHKPQIGEELQIRPVRLAPARLTANSA